MDPSKWRVFRAEVRHLCGEIARASRGIRRVQGRCPRHEVGMREPRRLPAELHVADVGLREEGDCAGCVAAKALSRARVEEPIGWAAEIDKRGAKAEDPPPGGLIR